MMNAVTYSVIEPIARRIREARALQQSVQLTAEQVKLLDEWMRYELELQADSEWLAHAVAAEDLHDFLSLDEAEAELGTLEAGDAV
jgi:hypothetical protein